MLATLLYSIARLLVDLLSVRNREQTELQVEVLALRHQQRVLQRQVRRPEMASRRLSPRWSPSRVRSGSVTRVDRPSLTLTGHGRRNAGKTPAELVTVLGRCVLQEPSLSGHLGSCSH
jgi:hypothetical protein